MHGALDGDSDGAMNQRIKPMFRVSHTQVGTWLLTVLLCAACTERSPRQLRPPASPGGGHDALLDDDMHEVQSTAGATRDDFGGPATPPIAAPVPEMVGADTILNQSCTKDRVRTNLRPTNLLFVIDRSGSMNCNAPPITASADCEREPRRAQTSQPTKWETVQRSLKSAFAALPRNVRVGLSYFSVDDACGVNSTPSVAIDALSSEQLEKLVQSLDDTSPGGGTPLVGATILAYRHLHELALRGLTIGSDVVVLLTDGEQSELCGSPDRCTSADSCVALLLDDAVPASARPGADIRTFVIGAPGSEMARPTLSQLAVEGQTARAGCKPSAHNCHLDMTQSADFSAALGDALSAIRGASARCDLPLPAVDAVGGLDLSRLNVVLSSDNGTATVLPRDERMACDAGANGWQYDARRGVLALCGDSCQRVRDEPSTLIDVVLGCPVLNPG